MVPKKSLTDLAVLGGPPMFEEKFHVGRPNIGDRSRLFERIDDLLDRCWLTNNGPFVQEFEQRLAIFLDARHCIAVCNGTVALEILIRALELEGEVIIPSLTFVATAHALRWLGLKPVFCEVDPATHNIDPARVESLITPATAAVMGVHLWGRACDVERLEEIARANDLKLIFDAAHAFGCSRAGRMIGNFGSAEVLSFHATKFFNTFEGGAIVTNDDALARKIRLMKNFGFDGYDSVACVGTNGKMSEVSAAMGLTNLESLDRFVAANRENYQQYRARLGEVAGIAFAIYDENESCNFQYVVAEIDERVAGIDRDRIVEALHAEGVLARRYFYPGCHRMEPYRRSPECVRHPLPETERLARQLISFPTGTAVDGEAIEQICSLTRFIVENGEALSAMMSARGESAHSSSSATGDAR